MERQTLLRVVMTELAVVLKPKGFSKKKGLRFFAERDEVVRWVELQVGRQSSDAVLLVTVNMGAYCLQLGRAISGEEPREWDILNGHWNIRLGHLLPKPDDRWWTIHNVDDAVFVGKEIAGFLQQYGIPASEKLSTTAQFRDLFLHGKGVLYTEERCKEMVAVLDKLLENRQ